jgi:rfaE bifunctional protein nucleotidyltransferase chain/domain
MIFKNIKDLEKIILAEKKCWKKIIWTNGCFDIMHPGHMKTFEKCRELADIIVVWMNWDLSPYWETKPWRPINNENFRSEMLSHLKNVDYIYIFNDQTPVEPVSVLKPDYILKWWDYLQESIKEYRFEKNGFIYLTEGYKKLIDFWIDKYCNEKGFMPEAVATVQNGWEVVLVPILEWCSTTKIVSKIKS